MNMKQVQWASQHDWFISAKETGSGYVVKAHDYYVKDGQGFWGVVYLDNFKKLREWAGY